MSKYTTEVRFICEHYAEVEGSTGFGGIDEVINLAMPKVFNFSYPIFDNTYKPILQKKILKHYYTREIGLETVGLWKLKLDTKLNEIMPLYNKLYETQLSIINPLYTTDINRKKDGLLVNNKNSGENIVSQNTNEDNLKSNNVDTASNKSTVSNTTNNDNNSVSSVNSTANNTDYRLYSDTPQGSLTGVNSETYLTNATKDTTNGSNKQNTIDSSQGKTSSDGTSTDNQNRISLNDTEKKSKNNYTQSKQNADTFSGVEDYLEHVYGYENKLPYDLLKDVYDNFLNIDVMIINELEPLFMQLW